MNISQIRIDYIDPSAYSLKDGGCVEVQRMTLDWDLPFLPRVGEIFDLATFFTDLGTRQGLAYIFSEYQRQDCGEGGGARLFPDVREVLSVSWEKEGDRVIPTLLLGDNPLYLPETDSAPEDPEGGASGLGRSEAR